MGPGVLGELLSGLPRLSDPNLLVGFEESDDAAVYKISDDVALITTADFFTPVVDDPYAFGAIAAANALSDVYAMNGSPKLAMNLLCFPSCIDLEVVKAILAGGYDKVKEAGAVLAGGHTIDDDIPKYGLSVAGFAHPNDIITNAGARDGDVLILTKPLGSGIVNTAIKRGVATDAQYKECLAVMAALNADAQRTFTVVKPHGLTDVTGFGLLGHGYEMASGSGVTLHIDTQAVPLMSSALDYAKREVVPGGAYRNFEYVQPHVAVGAGIENELLTVLADPQTSGGLLISVAERESESLLKALRDTLPVAARIGYVTAKSDHAIVLT